MRLYDILINYDLINENYFDKFVGSTGKSNTFTTNSYIPLQYDKRTIYNTEDITCKNDYFNDGRRTNPK